MYSKFESFKARNGHLQVPSNTPLYWWIHNQRYRAKMGDLSSEKRDLLEVIGFERTIPAISPAWMAMYSEFESFKARHGHLKVPSRTPLNKWINKQRYRAKMGDLSSEKRDLLEDIGF